MHRWRSRRPRLFVEVHPTRAAVGGGVGHQTQTPTHLGPRLDVGDKAQQPAHIGGRATPTRASETQVGRMTPLGQADTGEQTERRWPGGHSNCVAADLILQIRFSGPGFRGVFHRGREGRAAHRQSQPQRIAMLDAVFAPFEVALHRPRRRAQKHGLHWRIEGLHGVTREETSGPTLAPPAWWRRARPGVSRVLRRAGRPGRPWCPAARHAGIRAATRIHGRRPTG